MTRVMAFDPSEVYRNMSGLLNHFDRIQGKMFMDRMWIQPDKSICGCGCGVKLSGRRTRWATADCSAFANHVFSIIYGRSELISRYLQHIAGHYAGCMICSEVITSSSDNRNHYVEVDHILPVKQGGGGCWLSNYQQICIPCHTIKSKADNAALRLFKKNKTNQIQLL